MLCNEFTFRSADGKTDIHAVEWLPAGEVKAVLQISHGVAEYILRYAPFARFMTDRGWAVVGHDHLGHGGSVGFDNTRLYLGGKGSWQYAVDDLYTRRQLAGERFPGVPCFLMGHSMGSFLARSYLICYPGTVDGAILMGTGQMSAAALSAGRAVAIAEGHRVGEQNPSALVDKLAFGSYNRAFSPNRTDYDWLSVNPENVDRYVADPLCGGTPSTGLFREMLGGMRFNQKKKNLARMNMSTPILFISGACDPVGNRGKGVRKAYESFRGAGVRSVELKLWPELRHELLNECCGGEVAEELCTWLEAQI